MKTKVLGLVLVCLGMVFLGGCAANTLSDTISGHVMIDAPVEDVYQYMVGPTPEGENAAMVWNPAMKQMTDVEGEGTGTTFKWTYDVAGQMYKGEAVVTELIENEKEVVKSSGDIDSEWTFLWVPREGDKTKLIVVIEYSLEMPDAGGLAKDALAKRQAEGINEMLADIKKKVEEK